MQGRTGKILTSFIALATLASVAILWERNLVLTVVLAVLATLLLAMNKSRQELKTFFLCAFFGALAEAFVISSGTWTYSNPDIIGIPVWLTLLWGIAAVFIVRTNSIFKK
jgi:uncharacterized membrane protein YoaT (DUF817 family)